MVALQQKHGQGLVEYALLLMLVAIVLVVILTVYGGQVANLFSHVTQQLP
jgi:pilus assembly protein Flp/PilA